MVSGSAAEPGPTLTETAEAALVDILDSIHTRPLAVQADYARSRALWVAAAASLGFISTTTPAGFARTWRVTSRGLRFLEIQQ